MLGSDFQLDPAVLAGPSGARGGVKRRSRVVIACNSLSLSIYIRSCSTCRHSGCIVLVIVGVLATTLLTSPVPSSRHLAVAPRKFLVSPQYLKPAALKSLSYCHILKAEQSIQTCVRVERDIGIDLHADVSTEMFAHTCACIYIYTNIHIIYVYM